MQCPHCQHDRLNTMRHNDVEIDVCPNCGGIWLDRGELELLLTDCDQDNTPDSAETMPERPADRFQRFRRAYDGYFGGVR